MNGRTNSNGTTTEMLQVPLDPPTDFTIQTDNGQVRLTWTDPLDKYATPEGEQAGDPDQLVSVWSYTAIVRKEGSAPTGIHDGILVAESQVHNQYQSTPYIDTGLTNGVTYYYGLFAINESGIPSEGAIKDVTPVVGVAISTFPVGTIIKINENGAPAEWIIVNQGTPTLLYGTSNYNYDNRADGFNGTWVLRKEPAMQLQFDSESKTCNDYYISTIEEYIRTQYPSRFAQELIDRFHKVYVTSTYYETNFFLLSGYEVGLAIWAHCPDDGKRLEYFPIGDHTGSTPSESTLEAMNRRIAYVNGSPVTWWLRTGDGSSDVWLIDDQGRCTYTRGNSNSYNWMRPACVIKFNSFIDADMNLIVDN